MIRISNNEYIKVDSNAYVYLISNFFAIKKSTGEIYAFYKKLGRAPMLNYREFYQYLVIYSFGLVRDSVISETTQMNVIFPSTEYDVYQLNPEEEPMIHVVV